MPALQGQAQEEGLRLKPELRNPRWPPEGCRYKRGDRNFSGPGREASIC